MDIYLSSAYLPPVQYFAKLVSGGRCFVEQHENYVKQTYRTRCVIDSPNGMLALTVPVEKFATAKCLMKDVRISEHDNWRHRHWQALASSYFNSPFFEYYQDDFRPFYEKHWDFLLDFNEALVEKCCELIDVRPSIQRTDSYVQPCDMTETCKDFRTSLSPKTDWRCDGEFVPAEYYQVFAGKHGFLPNLSIIDLLFNMGPESILVLDRSISALEAGKNA
ncbi:MAG: WbqC family protein [Prevotellaceae bacterium]|nr:WbqC family protein [Prevotellaceae bacterium]